MKAEHIRRGFEARMFFRCFFIHADEPMKGSSDAPLIKYIETD